MEWCRCGQRPLFDGAGFCYLCARNTLVEDESAIESSDLIDLPSYELPIDGFDGGLRVLKFVTCAVTTGCLAFALVVGILLGWLLRAMR